MRTKHTVVVLAVMMIVAGSGLSQSDSSSEPGLVNVSIVQVKPGMMPEFEALKKEMSDALRKAGSTFVHVWQVARGTTNEYQTVSPVKNYAQFDEPSLSARAMGEEGFAKWVAKITKCIQTRRLITLRAVPSLSIPAKEGATPSLAILTTRENLPGRGGDYNTWMREKYLPALKKAGVEGFYVYRTAFGASGRGWTTVTRIDNWAALDKRNPLREALSAEEMAELFSDAGAMTGSPERIVIRYRPELSIQ